MPVPTGTSLCHRSGFAGNGSRDAHCSLAKRLILFLAKMKFAGKSQILRFIYQKLDNYGSLVAGYTVDSGSLSV
jgi:hypothetical protein